MAKTCVDCGIKLNWLNAGNPDGTQCLKCWKKEAQAEKAQKKPKATERDAEIERKPQQEQLEADQRMEIDAEIDAILITTETAPDLNIIERLDIVTAQAAFEINNFKDILVGFMNPVKGRSSELEKQLDILKERALYGLKEKAHDNSANAVVAIDIDISTVTIGQISMLMLVASGTAVVIEE